MSGNEKKFSGRVREYEKFRARYSQNVIDVLAEKCGLRTDHIIADLGAGTGMLAEIFLAHGNTVIAVEPNDEMLAVCNALKAQYPALRTVQATAEETTLPPHSVDFVTVGRAFHWFHAERALAEFRRILRPGGWVVLASVGRGMRRSIEEEGTPAEKALDAMLLRTVPVYAETKQRFNVYDRSEELFPGGRVFRESVESERTMTLEELIGQVQSASFAPHPGQPGYDALQQGLREVFAGHAVNGVISMPEISYLICAQFAPEG